MILREWSVGLPPRQHIVQIERELLSASTYVSLDGVRINCDGPTTNPCGFTHEFAIDGHPYRVTERPDGYEFEPCAGLQTNPLRFPPRSDVVRFFILFAALGLLLFATAYEVDPVQVLPVVMGSAACFLAAAGVVLVWSRYPRWHRITTSIRRFDPTRGSPPRSRSELSSVLSDISQIAGHRKDARRT
jgi:hypothetical protein